MDDAMKKQVKAALEMTITLAQAIRELGSVSSGELYATTCMPNDISLEMYQGAIDLLKRQGLVRVENHFIYWQEPAK